MSATNFVQFCIISHTKPLHATSCHFPCCIDNRLLLLLITYCWLFLLYICYIEEISKQIKIAKIHQWAIFYVFEWLLTVSTTLCLHAVRRHVDDKAHNHLPDLDACDKNVDPTRYIEPQCTCCIVGVHKWMDWVVHHHKPTTGTCMIGVAIPDVDHDSDVVIPMQED